MGKSVGFIIQVLSSPMRTSDDRRMMDFRSKSGRSFDSPSYAIKCLRIKDIGDSGSLPSVPIDRLPDDRTGSLTDGVREVLVNSLGLWKEFSRAKIVRRRQAVGSVSTGPIIM